MPAHRTEASETRGRGDASSKSVETAATSFISQQLGVAMSSMAPIGLERKESFLSFLKVLSEGLQRRTDSTP